MEAAILLRSWSGHQIKWNSNAGFQRRYQWMILRLLLHEQKAYRANTRGCILQAKKCQMNVACLTKAKQWSRLCPLSFEPEKSESLRNLLWDRMLLEGQSPSQCLNAVSREWWRHCCNEALLTAGSYSSWWRYLQTVGTLLYLRTSHYVWILKSPALKAVTAQGSAQRRKSAKASAGASPSSHATAPALPAKAGACRHAKACSSRVSTTTPARPTTSVEPLVPRECQPWRRRRDPLLGRHDDADCALP